MVGQPGLVPPLTVTMESLKESARRQPARGPPSDTPAGDLPLDQNVDRGCIRVFPMGPPEFLNPSRTRAGPPSHQGQIPDRRVWEAPPSWLAPGPAGALVQMPIWEKKSGVMLSLNV